MWIVEHKQTRIDPGARGRSLGERSGSVMLGLLAASRRQEPCQKPAEQVAELLLAVGWQASPDRRRRVDRSGIERQRRGGAMGRKWWDMASFRIVE